MWTYTYPNLRRTIFIEPLFMNPFLLIPNNLFWNSTTNFFIFLQNWCRHKLFVLIFALICNLYSTLSLTVVCKQLTKLTVKVKNKSKRWTEACSQPNQTSKIEIFVKMVHGFRPITISAKNSILDVWQGSEYTSD